MRPHPATLMTGGASRAAARDGGAFPPSAIEAYQCDAATGVALEAEEGSGPMPYRTILVHVNDQRRIEALLEPAIELAVRYNAHLAGMHVYTSLPLPQLQLGVRGRPGGMEREAEELAAAFARSTDGRPFVAEWRAVKVDHADFAPIVIEHALAADLIVASQRDPDWPLSGLLDFPERLALESGRPVLVVPYVGRYPRVGRARPIAAAAGASSYRRAYRPDARCI